MDASRETPIGEPLDAVEWARTVEPGRPLTLGEIESEVMRRRLPERRRIGAGGRVGQVIAFVVLGAVGLAVLAAPIVGTGVVVANAAGVAAADSDDLLGLGRIAFVVAASLPLVILAIWWNARDRHRSWWDIPALVVITLLAGASYVATRLPGVELGSGFVLWILAAVVTGIGVLVGLLVASRPGRAPKRAKRAPAEERFEQVRTEALSILSKRGLADIEDREITVQLVDMPRGGWIERDRQRGIR